MNKVYQSEIKTLLDYPNVLNNTIKPNKLKVNIIQLKLRRSKHHSVLQKLNIIHRDDSSGIHFFVLTGANIDYLIIQLNLMKTSVMKLQ